MIIVMAVVFNLLDLGGNAGLNMGILIGSAMVAGHYFLKDHQRLPTASEKAWLALLSLLASILVSVMFFTGIAVLEPEGIAAIGGML